MRDGAKRSLDIVQSPSRAAAAAALESSSAFREAVHVGDLQRLGEAALGSPLSNADHRRLMDIATASDHVNAANFDCHLFILARGDVDQRSAGR